MKNEKSEKLTPRFKETLELQELIERIEKQVEMIDLKGPEKERIVKDEIKSYLKELQKISSSSLKTANYQINEIKRLEYNQQVGVLISLVFEKGLNYAISVANALDNPAVLDEFHDLLVDRYYEILTERGILKK